MIDTKDLGGVCYMIERETYINKIRGFMDKPELIKIITGLRRSGKSVMLELIKKELISHGISKSNLISYNFEDMEVKHLKSAEALYGHIKKTTASKNGRTYLFLDELQEVENWEECVNSLRVNSETDIYITGSNAKMLAGEYATLLAGRYIEIQMYPFSFGEYCLAFCKERPEISEAELFKQYIRQGGMPVLSNLCLSETDAKQYLRDIYASVVIKDIMKRNNFRDVDMLERIIFYVLANIGKTFSATSISKYFKSENRIVATETILNYLKGCEEAFLFKKLRYIDVPGKKILKVNEKYYLTDHGLREAIFGYNERDIELVLENIVYMELLRRDYDVSVGRVGSREVDFIAKKGKESIYVQVCYLLASEETIEREFGVFSGIHDNYSKYVVSMDELDLGRDGIRHRNIREFLLAIDY